MHLRKSPPLLMSGRITTNHWPTPPQRTHNQRGGSGPAHGRPESGTWCCCVGGFAKRPAEDATADAPISVSGCRSAYSRQALEVSAELCGCAHCQGLSPLGAKRWRAVMLGNPNAHSRWLGVGKYPPRGFCSGQGLQKRARRGFSRILSTLVWGILLVSDRSKHLFHESTWHYVSWEWVLTSTAPQILLATKPLSSAHLQRAGQRDQLPLASQSVFSCAMPGTSHARFGECCCCGRMSALSGESQCPG